MFGQIDLAMFGIFVGTGIFLFLLGYFARRFTAERKLKTAEQRAKQILEEAVAG